MNSRLSFSAILSILFFFIGGFDAQAQAPNTSAPTSDTTKYLIIKNDGNEYVGLILSDDGREVLIETKSLGKIYIPKSDIKSIRPIDYAEDVAKGEFSSAGVFTTRYQFTTNCFPIKKGENYAMVNLYGPEVHFAVHKDFSVGLEVHTRHVESKNQLWRRNFAWHLWLPQSRQGLRRSTLGHDHLRRPPQ